jgi:hypothetical protein
MTGPALLVVLIFAAALVSCSDRAVTPDDDGNPETGSGAVEETGCETSDCGDPMNCGPDGLTCAGGLTIGECIAGHCGPEVIACVSGEAGFPTCDAVCADRDATCVPDGCEGATAYGWSDEYWQFCDGAMEPGRTALDISCGEAINFAAPESIWVACCCDFAWD